MGWCNCNVGMQCTGYTAYKQACCWGLDPLNWHRATSLPRKMYQTLKLGQDFSVRIYARECLRHISCPPPVSGRGGGDTAILGCKTALHQLSYRCIASPSWCGTVHRLGGQYFRGQTSASGPGSGVSCSPVSTSTWPWAILTSGCYTGGAQPSTR